MMMKSLLSASALALLIVTPVAAQQSATSSTTVTRPATTETRSDVRADQPKVVQQPGQIDAERLIGRNINSPEGERVGEIDSVLIGRDGKIQAVIVGVGGFLGIGERKVAIDWNQLKFQDNDQRVVANVTRDQLKNMPEFQYSDNSNNRDRNDRVAERDRTDRTRTATAPATGAQTRAETGATTTDNRVAIAPTTTTNTGATTTTVTTNNDRAHAAAATANARDMKQIGNLRADELIGKNVVNARGQTVGEIEDIVIDNNKAVMAVVSVGGFLGMGDKDVAIPFDQLRMNERNAILMSEANEDALKQLPAYKKSETWRSVERNRPVMDR